ncbi:MAG: hypothetical protein G01um101413_554 [Parcubacteria group bacterium Gr01-1014_13]|nr:MAG: hypothetical protein G01um101413_554 [Parcubacteria group bacterium Gr01-1014_13]
MRKGRGLVEVEIYDELLKITGCAKILLDNICNHRENPKTKKLCAEINEEAWPQVKKMVADFKRLKAQKKKTSPEQLPSPVEGKYSVRRR